jgi:hypothetical protein
MIEHLDSDKHTAKQSYENVFIAVICVEEISFLAVKNHTYINIHF